MRAVLDTNILVRANVKARGPARTVLTRIAAGPHVLIISPFLLRETQRVLAYPRLQAIWPLGPDDIRDYIELLADISDLVHPAKAEPVVRKDPDDDPVIQTAVEGRADVLCTLDRHFYKAEVKAYCRRCGIRIVTDVELLQLL